MPGGSEELEQSFAAFVRDHGERHLRVAVLLTGDWHAAEDLVQASLIKLYQAWPRVDLIDGDPDAYLRRVIVNTYRSWWRARWRRETPVAELPEHAAGDDTADRRALALLIRQALGELPRRQRAVVVLRYLEDLPEAEVASLLGCSAGSVKTHAHRGLRALRAKLSPNVLPQGEIDVKERNMNDTGQNMRATLLAGSDNVPPGIDLLRGVREQAVARHRQRRRMRVLVPAGAVAGVMAATLALAVASGGHEPAPASTTPGARTGAVTAAMVRHVASASLAALAYSGRALVSYQDSGTAVQ